MQVWHVGLVSATGGQFNKRERLFLFEPRFAKPLERVVCGLCHEYKNAACAGPVWDNVLQS
uniref:Uncharacterized protein n=1 Tax=Anguilla anguilla TaxID=7936 RepID=A0A0E9SAR9_ANGAN